MSFDQNSSDGVVIIGAGHAGTEVAFALRAERIDCPITLINGEDASPYQRPPLSKTYLLKGLNTPLRSPEAFANAKIDLRCANVNRIDRDNRVLHLENGGELRYGHLVLALGAKPNRLPMSDKMSMANLNDLQSTDRVRDALPGVKRIAIIGAGFIGLELACAAIALGKEVVVIDRAPRVLERATSPDISSFIEHRHRERGTKIVLDVGITDIQREGSEGYILTLSNGETIEADFIVEAVGVAPRTELARQANLHTDIGIVVDAELATSDPHISAIGDCAQFPSTDASRNIVITSVQNSVDQAKHLAKRLSGGRGPYAVVPWFWSDQASDKLQIAGLVPREARVVIRQSKKEHSFSVFSFENDRLVSVETMNAPADHIAARRLLAGNVSILPEQAADPEFNLLAFANQRQ